VRRQKVKGSHTLTVSRGGFVLRELACDRLSASAPQWSQWFESSPDAISKAGITEEKK
jgi:hypothetical protein